VASWCSDSGNPANSPSERARAARGIELGDRHAAREYIRQAREAGHGWNQIGQALGIAPNADADQAGPTVVEAAYSYAAGNPYTDAAVRYGRSFLSVSAAVSSRALPFRGWCLSRRRWRV
jgi:hypothetical protein